MNRGLVTVLVAIALGIGMFYLVMPTVCDQKGVPGRMLQVANNVKQISLAIYTFNANYHSGSMPEYKQAYPDKLSDLVQPDLLSQGELEKLTKGIDLAYMKPLVEKAAADCVILSTEAYGYSISGFASGEMSYKKQK